MRSIVTPWTARSGATAAAFLLAGVSVAQTVPPSYQASPDVYKVVAENANLRIVEVSWAPGQRDQPHGHPAAGTYFLTDCKLRFFLADGSSRDTEPKAGFAAAQAPVPSHSVQNIGTTTCKLVMFEPK